MTGRPDFVRVAKNRIRTTPGTKLDPNAIDKAGSVLNITVNGASAMAEECDSRSAARQAALITSTARDVDLDRLTLDQTFGKLARKGAAAATFPLTVQRTGTNSGSVLAGTIIVAGGLQYTLDPPGLFFQAGTLQLTGNFTCTTLGSAGNQPATALSGFSNPGALFDPTLTVTAPLIPSLFVAGLLLPDPNSVAAGGAEPESDADFRARRGQWDAGLDRNLDSLAAGAKNVPGITYAYAVEDLDANGLPIGSVSLFVADVNGRANSALLARVRAQIRGFRLQGQRVNLVGSSPSLQTIQLHFGVLSTYDIGQVQTAARGAVVAYVNSLQPGQILAVAGLAAAIKSVAGVVFDSLAGSTALAYGVVSPAADVAPVSISTIFRTTTDLVSFV